MPFLSGSGRQWSISGLELGLRISWESQTRIIHARFIGAASRAVRCSQIYNLQIFPSHLKNQGAGPNGRETRPPDIAPGETETE